ncbi:aldehyde dehydrogenase family protein, partial [Kineococcus glutinatus]|uniref:aldehyde dehydrogenase family protein n=1 Tax=Kineococcus glutinatus TaxID=1070872 RepID=UPI0031E73856
LPDADLDLRAVPVTVTPGDVVRALPSRPSLVGASRAAPQHLGDLLQAAAAGAAAWAGQTPVARGRALVDLAAEVEGRRSSFVTEARRSGLQISGALAEVDAAVDRLVWWAGWADKLDLLPAPVPPPGHGRLVERGPGVVLVVAPAARALLGPVSVLAPPLVAGGACLLVPAAAAAQLADLLARAALAAVLPAGLLTVAAGGQERV